MAKALVVAAPSSGSGKTVLTLGLIRALRDRGLKVASAKVGPDYIDPALPRGGEWQALLQPRSLGDGARWSPVRFSPTLPEDSDLVIIEGVMGLFDGPQGAKGSTADLAALLGLPVVLAIDARHQSQSIAALVAWLLNLPQRRSDCRRHPQPGRQRQA